MVAVWGEGLEARGLESYEILSQKLSFNHLQHLFGSSGEALSLKFCQEGP